MSKQSSPVYKPSYLYYNDIQNIYYNTLLQKCEDYMSAGSMWGRIFTLNFYGHTTVERNEIKKYIEKLYYNIVNVKTIDVDNDLLEDFKKNITRLNKMIDWYNMKNGKVNSLNGLFKLKLEEHDKIISLFVGLDGIDINII